MAGPNSRRANKLAQSLLAFALSATLIAEPALTQAQDNPAAPPCSGGRCSGSGE